MFQVPRSTKQWAKSLIAAGVSGGATAGLASLGITGATMVGVQTKPLDFKQFWIIVGSGALVGVMMYLKTSPVPPDSSGNTELFKRQPEQEQKP